MVEFKAIVNDVKTGKSYNVAVTGHHANSLIGKSIGEIVDGIFVGLPGYKLKITGGSDRNGTPMRADLPGPKRKKLLLSDGLGFRERYPGERKRVAIRGSTISGEIVQINMAVSEYGPRSIEESFAPAPAAEKAPAEKK
jgi:small subunit ribosomal protein S6e